MKKIISHILIILLFAASIAAQDGENQPRMIDEFGEIGICEMEARIDAFAVALMNAPLAAKALVRISGGREDYLARVYYRGSLIAGFWKNRSQPAERLSIQFCSVNKEPLMTRLYIVDENESLAPCEENLSVPAETALFQSVYFYEPVFKFTALEDYSYLDTHGVSSGEYSRFAQNALKKLLSDSPESRVYVIGYLLADFETDDTGQTIAGKPPRLDKKSLTGKMLQAARDNLLKNGFSPSQIVTIDGGYINDTGRRLDFWLVPKGGAIPKPKPNYFPKKKQKT